MVTLYRLGIISLKYNFESNSQQPVPMTVSCIVGNYKLKYNFESNSQPVGPMCSWVQIVGNYKLKYNFESNSQQEAVNLGVTEGWEL